MHGSDPTTDAAHDPEGRAATRAWVPQFVLWLSLGLTILVAVAAHREQVREDRVRFARAAERTRIALVNRIDVYTSTLRHIVALFQTGGIPNRETVNEFLTRLDVQGRYPGLQGIGLTLRLNAADREAFEKKARDSDVDPAFRVWPVDPPRDEYHSIMYLEPSDERNRRAIGYDMHSDPVRAAAMDAARDNDAPAVSGPVRLVQEFDDGKPAQAGFLIYMPLYKPGEPLSPVTVEERRAKLIGHIYSPFRADDLFRGIFTTDPYAQVDFRLYDGVAEDPAQLLHDSYAVRTNAAGVPAGTDYGADDPARHSRFTRREPVEVAGRRWTMLFFSRPEFEQRADAWLVPLIVASGTVVSFTFFQLTRRQVRSLAAGRRAVKELERAQSDTRRSESRFRRLVDANLAGVAFCRLGDNVITDGNEEFLRITGRRRDTFTDGGTVMWDAISAPETLDADRRALAQLTAAGTCTPFEKAFVRPDGSRVPVLVGAAMLEGGGRDECVVLCVDIAQRKRFERELHEAKDAAEQANRAKDRFLAVLSHELRTPLAPVLLAVSIWERDGSLNPELREDFEMIRRNVELEARLIDDLLDLTRIGRGKLHLDLVPVDVHATIQHAMEIGPEREAEAKHLTIEGRLEAADATVMGDAARLQQSLWNLLHNAVKFTPAGGRVEVRTSNPVPGWLRIEVCDTGIGIEPDLLPIVFNAFEQGAAARSRASGGLGLGLAITHGLIHAHGGTVTAASEGVGRGATFIVELPTAVVEVADDPGSPVPEVAKRQTDLPPANGNGQVRILMVEDHLDSARMLERLLRAGGYAPHVAGSVSEASQAASMHRFDLLLTDLSLPDGTGVDVLRALRATANHSFIPAIALTGHGMPEDVMSTEAAGFCFHLTKPVDLQQLRTAIDRAVGRENGHGML